MAATVYSVTATLPDEGLAREYVAWLCGGHVDAVIRGGARSGMVTRLEEPVGAIQVETRYVFASRGDYDRYVRETAPGLRAEGIKLFGPERGIRMERRLGAVLQALTGPELARDVLAVLRERGLRLSTAESCTGGLLGGALTAVPGSSDVYVGGWVTYANAMKTSLLGVAAGLLGSGGSGAVSREVAEAMASGGRERSGSDLCVSITGIAGPGGGSPEKPVGTVWIGIAGAAGVSAGMLRLSGDRAEVRERAVGAALERVLAAASGG